ncbi:universal stress protein [Planctomicrobium sp. SH668]|uniref:universal stress protein n=1 Tax=Planctomicrobium sp. SH668 TaxID=3448126 RepID=UPI003F5B6882
MALAQRILVGAKWNSDESVLTPASRAAVEQAIWIAGNDRTEVILITILEMDSPEGQRSVPTELQQCHEAIALDARTAGISFHAFVAYGDAADILEVVAEDEKCDLIVLGLAGQDNQATSDLSEFVQGIIQNSGSSVLAIRSGTFETFPPTIVAVEDLNGEETGTLRKAVSLAQFTRSRLFVLANTEETSPELIKELEDKLLSRLVQTDCRTLELGVRTSVVSVPLVDALNEAIAEHSASLVLLECPPVSVAEETWNSWLRTCSTSILAMK